MCDLIDLTSPDRNDLLGKKLASPLIPIPTDTGGNNSNLRKDGSSSLITGKRESLDNNPFDNVLHKITEYIQKKDDPFEVILEKAQSEEYNEEPSSKRYSDDNSNRKKKVHYQKLKRHRTLDEFLLTSVLNKKDAITIKASNENIGVNVKKNHILNNDLKSDGAVPTITIENMDSSILSQSGMNDTLFEGNGEQDKIQMKSTLGDMKDNEILSATLKVPKVRRSLSHGDTLSPKKSCYLNCFSLVEPPKVGLINRSNVSNEQQNSVDFLNEGFLKSRSGSSIFSSLSNISSIPKLNSVSSTVSINGSSAIVSDDTMNRSFLGSCSSDKSERLMKTPALNVSTRTSICDLAERLNKIRIRASEMYTPENFVNNKDDTCSPPSSIKESVSLQGNTEKSDVNNKLIDVDLFTSGIKSNNECSSSSTSDTSTDSVFVEGNKINKLIRKEAKYLARTFEEFASKTNSESSVDDLITNSPSWMPELVPAFDDEISVDNLIELPVSPEGNNAKSEEPKVTEHKGNDSLKNKENVRDLEMELVEPIHTEKHLTAATLLLDLKKLIKTENNIEANKLVENLEKTLGVNCVTNTELLTAYLSVTNNLAKSPKKSSSNLEIIKNVGESTMEHSQEDNLTGSSMGSIKESVSFEYVNFNDPDMIKSTDNQKSLNDVNIESNSEIDVGIENVEEIKKANSKIVSEEKSALKMEKNTSINEKLVIELLANIGKLIYAQTEEHPTEDIVTKLRKALQATSRNCNTDNDIESNNAHIEIQQTPKKPKSKFENRSKSLGTLQSANTLSLNLESKEQPVNKNVIRRSISVSQTLPMRNKLNSSMSTSKSTSQLNQVPKRFPSDPGFVSPSTNKTLIKHTRVKAVAVLDIQKEKPSVISTVKNKLKKKIGTDVVNKKGPMKAILPIGIMQRRESFNKKTISSTGSITPPQSHKIISSTPNSANKDSMAKKSRSTTPVASSTPDVQDAKKIQSKVATSPKKRNFSYEISPVTTRVSVNKAMNNSSRSKLPSPKRTTPKQSKETGIPRSRTPPIRDRLHSSLEFNRNERMHVSPQRTMCKTSKLQKTSPISFKKIETQQSPLKDSNKIAYKVKPMNLISKLRRHSFGTNAMEKENNYI
ncbi:uncharacterized protein LOC108626459 isoform X2 [Ceratina calcarata]|uniref:Uncharacterized protein LOC108626459 isoform X2 n=1 Tax=Ceratina calcarata TaxID=156304 RepID=A0AAJ7J2U4_9HYME|nr:uncharacterized protein LOC108626459 isoform X2 [Ceratina calcarata]